MERTATFSRCRKYRFELWRRWKPGPYVNFIGLNPSTADETLDDPTIRRCINFAKAWGFSGFCMTNIFAFRATDPNVMKSQEFPIGGLENDRALRAVHEGAAMSVAAWGVHGEHRDRAKDVESMLPNLYCLGKTKDGHPKHPLYLKKTTRPFLLDPPTKPGTYTFRCFETGHKPEIVTTYEDPSTGVVMAKIDAGTLGVYEIQSNLTEPEWSEHPEPFRI